MRKSVPFPGTVFKSRTVNDKDRLQKPPHLDMFNQKDHSRYQPFSCSMMNLKTDLDDVADAISGDVSWKVHRAKGHCSAIVKLLSGHKDLLVSHTTWTEWVSSKYHIVCKCSRPLDSISNATLISRVRFKIQRNRSQYTAVIGANFFRIGWENNRFWGNDDQSCKPLNLISAFSALWFNQPNHIFHNKYGT